MRDECDNFGRSDTLSFGGRKKVMANACVLRSDTVIDFFVFSGGTNFILHSSPSESLAVFSFVVTLIKAAFS